jgi:hypothetical protein
MRLVRRQRAREDPRKMTKRNTGASRKEHGGWLSAWLIFIGLQGILYTFLILYLRGRRQDPSPAWLLVILFSLSLADIVAVIATWKWKKWGVQLYALSTFIGIAVGLVFTGSQLIVFHDIVPLAILGYLIKDKWRCFA